jgi:nicotinate-nucleotide--dimethylbenzimidazole phosphoribosyltransferase
MVHNFLDGGAAINVLARRVGARVVVVDLGVAADLPTRPDLVARKIGFGTRNLAVGPAMDRAQALAAMAAGAEVLTAEIERGLDIVATGEMGIANTTAASAIVAAITGAHVADVTGRGTGIDDERWALKVKVIRRSLEINKPDARDPLDVLAKLGGFEIAGLVGLILEAASRHVPVVIDGFITGAAALIATELRPEAREYLIPAHNSVEIGHRVMLERMELTPLLNLDLRLGEGTGAAIVMHLVDDAVAILDEMATFADAGVSEAL